MTLPLIPMSYFEEKIDTATKSVARIGRCRFRDDLRVELQYLDIALKALRAETAKALRSLDGSGYENTVVEEFDHAADEEIRKREDAAIRLIEANGVEHLYTYNPDGVARRHAFANGVTVVGLTSLEGYAGMVARPS